MRSQGVGFAVGLVEEGAGGKGRRTYAWVNSRRSPTVRRAVRRCFGRGRRRVRDGIVSRERIV